MRRLALAAGVGVGLGALALATLPASGGPQAAWAGPEPGHTVEITATSGTTLYLPLVTREWWPPAWYSVYFPADSWFILAEGDNLTDTLDGSKIVEIGVVEEHLWVDNLPRDPMRPRYHVARSYVAVDLSGVPRGRIVSATLELYTDMLDCITGDFLIRFHEGQWDMPLSDPDWSAYGDLLGVYDTRLWEGPGLDKPIWVPLPGLVGREVPPELKLVVRGEEETDLPYGAYNLGARFALVWNVHLGGDGSVVSRLHLRVEP